MLLTINQCVSVVDEHILLGLTGWKMMSFTQWFFFTGCWFITKLSCCESVCLEMYTLHSCINHNFCYARIRLRDIVFLKMVTVSRYVTIKSYIFPVPRDMAHISHFFPSFLTYLDNGEGSVRHRLHCSIWQHWHIFAVVYRKVLWPTSQNLLLELSRKDAPDAALVIFHH